MKLKNTLLLSIVLIFSILLLPTVLADDVTFTINGLDTGELAELEISGGGELIIVTELAPNVVLESIDIDTKNELLSQLIDYEVQSFSTNEKMDEVITIKEVVPLPELLPAGNHDFFININYLDANGMPQSITNSLAMDVNASQFPEGLIGVISGFLSADAAAEIVDLLTDRVIPPLPKEITKDEVALLTEQLGFSSGDIDSEKYTVKLIEEKTLTQDVTNDKLEELKDVNDKVAMALKEIKKLDDTPLIEKELKVFEVTNEEGEIAYVTRVIIRITHTDSINDLVVVEEIPKDVAMYASDIEFLDLTEVLEEDPIVKWNFDHVPKDQAKEFGYSVDKKLDTVDSTTIAGGNEPSAVAKWIRNLFAKWFN